MRWRIEDLATFAAVADAGGVSAAAARLGAPKSTVSKALARLEDDLGARLIERTSRRMRMTPEGTAFLARAGVILDLAEAADSELQGLRSDAPSGRVSLSLPAAFCREILAPRLGDFARAYPGIVLDLVVPTRGSTIYSDACDLAVVVGPQPDSSLTQKLLFGARVVWVASPAYAAAHAIGDAPPADFSDVKICESRFVGEPTRIVVGGVARRLELPRAGIQVNDPLTVREAVRGGLGVTLLAERYCTQALREGSLIEVWREVGFEAQAGRIAVVFPGHRLLSPRFRAVIDFLERICRDFGSG